MSRFVTGLTELSASQTPGAASDVSARPRAAEAAAALVVDNLSKGFGEGTRRVQVIGGLSMALARGQFVSVIGPSGCGKTTLLRLVAGLLTPDSGRISIFGGPVTGAVAAKQIGLVPQSPALFPWRSVLDNVRLPLEVNKKARRAAQDGRADPVALLESFGLGEVLYRRPAELSGGMQQRVAIARALVFDPAVLLMDEPFAAVDELTRETLRHELLDIWQSNRKTVLFVTHSIPEAILLSDAVAVMSPRPGKILRVVPVDLPRPRGELVESTVAFHELERELRLEIRSAWRHG